MMIKGYSFWPAGCRCVRYVCSAPMTALSREQGDAWSERRAPLSSHPGSSLVPALARSETSGKVLTLPLRRFLHS